MVLQKLRPLVLAVVALPVLGVSSPPQDRPAVAGAIWTVNFDTEIKWFQSTLYDVSLVQTVDGIHGVNGATGEILWSHEGIEVQPEDITQYADLIIVSVPEDEDDGQRADTMAVELLTGTVRWRQPQVRGRTLKTLNMVDRGQVLLINSTEVSQSKFGSEAKKQLTFGFGGGDPSVKPLIYLVDLGRGELLWELEYPEKVKLIRGRTTFGGSQFSLDGLPEPAIEGSTLYLPWSGLTRVDLETGRIDWRAKYKTTYRNFHQTGTYVLEEGTAYTSERGQVRAVDLSSGKILWKRGGLGEVAPQLFLRDNLVIAKVGGVFYDADNGAYFPLGRKGMVGIDRGTGKRVWKYDDPKQPTTNAIEWRDIFVLADSTHVYGVRTDGTESFRQQTKFVDGFPPYLSVAQGENTVAVRSQLQRMLFDIESKTHRYNKLFPPPKVSTWKQLAIMGMHAGGSFLAFGGSLKQQLMGLALTTTATVWTARINRRRERIAQYDFFVTRAAGDEDKTAITRIDRINGQTRTVVVYQDEGASPTLDLMLGRAYTADGRMLIAHDLLPGSAAAD